MATTPVAPSPGGGTGRVSPPRRQLTSSVRGIRAFSSSVDAARLRRPTDILLLAGSGLLLLALALAAPGPTNLDQAVADLLKVLPDIADWVWQIGYGLLGVWTAVLLVIPAVSRGRRGLLLDYLAAGLVAFGVAALASWAEGTTWDDVVRSLVDPSSPTVYLAVRLAVVSAVVVVASPHVSRPLRHIGRVVLGIGAASAVVLDVALPIGAVAGFLAGVAAAALVHLLRGSPAGRPTVDAVGVALGDLGVDASDVRDTDLLTPGVALFTASDSDGARLLVKVFGRDAWDGQFLASTWTALTMRGESPQLGVGRVGRVEHEALATLLAERAGIPVLAVVAVGRSVDDDALIATRLVGRPAVELDADALTDPLLASTWSSLASLHDVGIAHGRVDLEQLMVDGDVVRWGGFGQARLSASTSALMTDRARLLVSTALVVGQDRAVAAALGVIGTDGLADIVPFLQPAALDHATRRAVHDEEWKLDDLRDASVAAAGVEPPELQKIARVNARSVAIVALVAAFSYVIISMLAGVQWSSVVSAMQGADWIWVVAALVVSPIIELPQSGSTLGASNVRLRFFPVLMLQYAIQFIALTLPATAARLALQIRFFERFGIAPGAAVSIGVIDSVSGFTVQVSLLLLIWLSPLPGFTSSLRGETSTSSTSTTSSGPSILVVAILLVVIGLVVSLLVPRIRARLFGSIPKWRTAVKAQLVEVRESLTVLRQPRKVALMLGGNLGAQVLQAVALGLCLEAFGSSAHLSQLILINTFVSLFAGLMPVPGGMGVAEAGYTAGLQAIGVPSAVAISTAIAFRMVTFYLPPIWGAFAMRWLRKRAYV